MNPFASRWMRLPMGVWTRLVGRWERCRVVLRENGGCGGMYIRLTGVSFRVGRSGWQRHVADMLQEGDGGGDVVVYPLYSWTGGHRVTVGYGGKIAIHRRSFVENIVQPVNGVATMITFKTTDRHNDVHRMKSSTTGRYETR